MCLNPNCQTPFCPGCETAAETIETQDDFLGTATYDPADNKLRLHPFARLSKEDYTRVKAAGFSWAPRQELFVAPMWTPSREDLLIEMCGEIGDEDTSLVDRAEERAERFEEYSDKRTQDAERAHAAVDKICEHIPLGQPILIGHHSERHARKDAQRIENGMRTAVKMWETAKYWEQRAAGALHHAKYKELPAVRARRIKGIEADARKQERHIKEASAFLKMWENDAAAITRKDGEPTTFLERARRITGADHISKCFTLAEFPRPEGASTYEGMTSLYSALGDGKERVGFITAEQARDIAVRVHNRSIAHANRWLDHYNNRIAYERAMLGEQGGTVADQKKPEKGGACKCWVGRGAWLEIAKVNKVSVSVADNWGNGGPDFLRTVKFDDLTAVMTKAEFEVHKAAGQVAATTAERQEGWQQRVHAEAVAAVEPKEPTTQAKIDAIRAQLKTGVQVVTAPQLFPTPPELAARMVQEADVMPGHRVLEPSAGTGNILAALPTVRPDGHVTAVEISSSLIYKLEPYADDIVCGDFMEQNGNLGKFDRILMNPPFANGQDIKHIQHAVKFLKPGGRLVAICAGGPRQAEQLMPIVEASGGIWEPLPAGTFKDSGTNVNTVLLTIEG